MAATVHKDIVEVLARVRGGAVDFDDLYEAHVDRLWHFIERLGVPARFVDDATQDTFIIAHRQLGSFRGDASLSTWLHGIALRVAKDYKNREQLRGWEPIEPEAHQAQGTPFEKAADREELRLVLTLLDELNDQQREVLVLTEFEGFTAMEVAALTDANPNTVASRLRAARARFNELVLSIRVGP